MNVIEFENFLSEPKKYSDYINNLLTRPNTNTLSSFGVNYSWPKKLFPDPNCVPPPILIHYLEYGNSKLNQELKNEIDVKLSEKGLDFEVGNIVIHVMTKGSWINWHTDGYGEESGEMNPDVRAGGLTIYLNHEWGLDKGGEFMYNIDNKVERVNPSFNKGILVNGDVSHKTTPVLGNNLRKSLQVWLKRKGS